jgi:hypothetical protein
MPEQGYLPELPGLLTGMTAQPTPDATVADKEARADAIRLRQAIRARRRRAAPRMLARRAC